VNEHSGTTFVLDGPPWTCKTFVYNTIVVKFCAQGQNVICVVSFGIEILLIDVRWTTHSTFNLPIQIINHSICILNETTIICILLNIL
jgi:hypothetical protein